ncbi:MAG: hypothetical protein GY932_12205 [Arcobacter sp.]|nr:hypothetical protein [Arcobacter sp.]
MIFKTSFISIILIVFLSGCSSNQNSIEYTNHFFIIDKRLTLQKADIENIKYKENKDGSYNVDLILKKRGLNKLKYLFKNSVNKHFGMVVNNKVIQFNIPIIDNIFEESDTLDNKIVHFQFTKEKTRYFLNSFGIEFKE